MGLFPREAHSRFLTWPKVCFSSFYTPAYPPHSRQSGPGQEPAGSRPFRLGSLQGSSSPQLEPEPFPGLQGPLCDALSGLLDSSLPGSPLLLLSGLSCVASTARAIPPRHLRGSLPHSIWSSPNTSSPERLRGRPLCCLPSPSTTLFFFLKLTANCHFMDICFSGCCLYFH